MSILPVYKHIGETPLSCIARVVLQLDMPSTEKVTYAGRLDPAGCGVLVLLSGEDVHKKPDFLSLPKSYELLVVLGISTDTGDLLGIPTLSPTAPNVSDFSSIDTSLVSRLQGTHEQQYPLYSSKPVDGKPLFAHGLSGNTEVIRPSHQVTIHSISASAPELLTNEQIVSRTLQIIDLVSGEFRQEEIRQTWEHFSKNSPATFVVIPVSVNCSSGTYMRVLAEDIGKLYGTSGVLFSLIRTSVGNYRLSDQVA